MKKPFIKTLLGSVDSAVIVAAVALIVSIASIMLSSRAENDATIAGARSELSDILLRLHEITREGVMLTAQPHGGQLNQALMSSLTAETKILVLQAADLVEILDKNATETELYATAMGLYGQAKFERCETVLNMYDHISVSPVGRLQRDLVWASLYFATGKLDEGRKEFSRSLETIDKSTRLANYSSLQAQLVLELYCNWAINEAQFGDIDLSAKYYEKAQSAIKDIKGLGYQRYSKSTLEATAWTLKQLESTSLR
jgi:tetratricopeptide (TPR) repeat protein